MKLFKMSSLGLLILLVLILVGALAAPIGFVMCGRAKLPTPTGNFQVGRDRMILKDTSRPEIFTPDPADKREMVLNIFYPAHFGKGEN
jgi:hypothetical protein